MIKKNIRLTRRQSSDDFRQCRNSLERGYSVTDLINKTDYMTVDIFET